MAVQTKYVCDKCGIEKIASAEFYDVALMVRAHHAIPNVHTLFRELTTELWCYACLKALDELKRSCNFQPAQASGPTLEDLVRRTPSQTKAAQFEDPETDDLSLALDIMYCASSGAD